MEAVIGVQLVKLVKGVRNDSAPPTVPAPIISIGSAIDFEGGSTSGCPPAIDYALEGV
jgi:hypothetical protein